MDSNWSPSTKPLPWTARVSCSQPSAQVRRYGTSGVVALGLATLVLAAPGAAEVPASDQDVQAAQADQPVIAQSQSPAPAAAGGQGEETPRRLSGKKSARGAVLSTS